MNATTSPEQRIAAALELIAGETGEAHWRHAASELRRLRSVQARGRKCIDDSEALAEMQVLVAAGEAVETAARYVSATLPDSQSQEASTRRLARKYRRAAFNSASN